jgi:tRNA-Thr(GGU) m(6)t(6)A37 methyltransferase TsaA
MHWFGNPTWFAVPLQANVWDVFGKGCFIIELESRRVVPMDDAGFTTEPLIAGASYALYGKSGSKLLRECHNLRVQMNALRGDMTRVSQRANRFERVTVQQLTSASEILAAALAPCEHGAAPNVQSVAEALSQLRVLQRRIETIDVADTDAGEGEGAPPPRAVQTAPSASANAALSAAGAGTPAELLADAVPVVLAPRGGCARGKPDHPHQWSRMTRGGSQHTAGGVSFSPIGHISSCFAEKNGTPRQGSICPASRATIELKLPDSLNAVHALEGLEEFSHVWLLWQFHQNGPASIRSKVSPPRLDGERVGLYATRSPHRPNAIGLSAVRLERIEGTTLHLSGVDLIEGTPIFDIKPYVPIADSLPPGEVRVPYWLRPETAPVADLEVDISDEARAQICALERALTFFRSAAEAEDAIRQVLRADPRSVFWRHSHKDETYGFSIDQLNVVCRFDAGRAIVVRVEHLALGGNRSRTPTSAA